MRLATPFVTPMLFALMCTGTCSWAQSQAYTPVANGSKQLANVREANGPVNMPGWPQTGALRDLDHAKQGTCTSVRYGDIVHFTLRVENVQDARSVFTNLRMGLGAHPHYSYASLPMPDAVSFGGGGVGVRDAADYQLYHFRFEVPDVRSGIYRVAGIDVRANYDRDANIGVGIDKPTRVKLKNYCLAVFGGEGGDHRPMVTDFRPDPVEHPAQPPDRVVFP
ncbi:hypothetical protein ACFQBQ_17975 [Granulicella cerasi]|uniref:DUF11 domain-containing protein n=1 Tax=Granulicella cerasi TaxID=741063 RepID=A0ABW1ZD80_9BACT|nr:hypothetical protein [Granulicella cerasi]